MSKKRLITIIGSGYVGMSLSVLLSKGNNHVKILEIDKDKVKKINDGLSTVRDELIEKHLAKDKSSISATLDPKEALTDADYFIVATPTNYDEKTNKFDTESVKSTVEKILKFSKNGTIIIKSTIPIGYTEYLKEEFKTNRIIFSPEFLREGNALYDNLYPSRIIIGDNSQTAVSFAEMLKSLSLKKSTKIIYMSSREAEAVKLFSNTYLAMRVAFFNELDSFAMENKLQTLNLISGISEDPRIGNFYNNPSFGYGGYCLPKDTKQLLANYKNIPQNIIQAIVESNSTRKDYIVKEILKYKPKMIGIYQLAMKSGSDNFRSSSILSIIERIKKHNIPMIIYENQILDKSFNGVNIEKDLHIFKNSCDLIITNRITDDLSDVVDKVFTRDLFGYD
ncbi:MAG: UDP-glucose 6-dehydrogenase [Candidatus Marinimicrobia bacterium]|nr:UDP-glucose 6-dehydrogenase [Candidatus Neomarinimicrobiota bacterium]